MIALSFPKEIHSFGKTMTFVAQKTEHRLPFAKAECPYSNMPFRGGSKMGFGD
jgi:hypothetical protein